MQTALKKLFAVICLALLVIVMSGCSGDGDIDPSNLAEQVKSQTAFSELRELSGTDLSSHFEFKDADVQSFSVMISATGESADTIACFKLRDDDKSAVVAGITQYLAKRSTSFKATMVNEYEKIQNRLLVQVEDTVVLVICGDYTAVSEYLDELGAEEIV